jgi:hypothetical protein
MMCTKQALTRFIHGLKKGGGLNFIHLFVFGIHLKSDSMVFE